MDRFFDKVEKTDTCWIWKAAIRGKTGYGCMKWKGKTVDAHRISYELHNGPIPDGKLVCHTCDNRLCVNPNHLFLGTYSDNMQDCKQKGRLGVRKKKGNYRHPSWGAYRNGCRCTLCVKMKKDSSDKYCEMRRVKNGSKPLYIIPKEIRQKIAFLLSTTKMTQVEIARLANVGQTTVSKINTQFVKRHGIYKTRNGVAH